MTHNLSFRLLAAFTLVIVVILGSVFFLFYRTTRSEIAQFETRIENLQDNRVQLELYRYYSLTGSWERVQSLVEQWGSLYGRRIILTDVLGTIVADSDSSLIGTNYANVSIKNATAQLSIPAPSPILDVFLSSPGQNQIPPVVNARIVGYLYTVHGSLPGISAAALQITYQSVGRFAIRVGLIAIVIAIFLAYFLSRRILSPVKALTRAARQFGKGDFSSRVDYHGKGEMGELAASFNSMAQNLEKNEQIRRNLVADVAHELRTPISNLRGYLEAISDGVVKPDEATIRSLNEEAGSLARLVGDLQELTLADAGTLKMDMQVEDVSRLIKESVTAIQAKSLNKGVNVSADIPGELPLVEIDAQRIRQVINNLLNNAVEHTGQGGRVTVSGKPQGNMVLISVADTGEGIAPEHLPMIFERFYRVDKSRTRSTGGSGLGLTIARRLVEAHGGTIGVTSQPGQGSVFTFSIPVSPEVS